MPVSWVPMNGYKELVASTQRRARLVRAALRRPEGLYRVNKSQQSPNEDIRLVRFGRPRTTKSGNHHRCEPEPVSARGHHGSAAALLTRGAFVVARGAVQRAGTAGLHQLGR